MTLGYKTTVHIVNAILILLPGYYAFGLIFNISSSDISNFNPVNIIAIITLFSLWAGNYIVQYRAKNWNWFFISNISFLVLFFVIGLYLLPFIYQSVYN